MAEELKWAQVGGWKEMKPWHFRIKDYKMFKNLADLCKIELKMKLTQKTSKKVDEKPERKPRGEKKINNLDEKKVKNLDEKKPKPVKARKVDVEP